MLQVILTKGLPGSGKSTWSKNLIDKEPNKYKRVSKDDLRAMLDNSKHSDDSEKFILQIRDSIILQSLEKGKHVIVDDTNLSVKHENRIRELIKGKAEVNIMDFTNVSLEDCIKNDLKRSKSVGEAVIKKMYNQFLKSKPEIIEYIPLLPEIIICDLDGTLCHLNGRNPYDASTCENDILNPVVASIIKDQNVILVSGREDKYRQATIKFLENHDIHYIDLYMRDTDDFRNDAIIKKEIYEKYIKGKFNVKFVLDDRNRVVELWRSLGLTCLQVADGNF